MSGVRRGAVGFVLVVLGAGFLSPTGGCSDGESSAPLDDTATVETITPADDDLAPLDHQPSFEADYNNLVAQPWVEPVTPAQRDAVDVFPDRLVYPDTMTAVATWQPGRLVVSGPGQGAGKNPWGFARRVVEVEHLGSQYVVTTAMAAIEDVIQGDFQLQLKPEALTEVDLDQIDPQWVADNLYFVSPEADTMEGELLVDDFPDDQEALGLWKRIKRVAKKARGAARAVVKGAVELYKKVTPATVSGSVKLSPTITFGDARDLFTMEYSKPYKTKKGLSFTVALKGKGSYDASVTVKPGVQVGAKIALPGHKAKSVFWVNIDSSLALKLALAFDLEASITSADGKTGSQLQQELDRGAGLAAEVLAAQRQQLLGDPDMRPQGGWKKTLWISKPMTQTFAAGPVPVVLVETAQLDMECGFQAKAGLKAKLQYEQNATMKFSLRSDTGAKPPTFAKTKKTTLEVTGAGEVTANCGLIPRINVFLYDTVGLFAGVRGSLVATGKYQATCKDDPRDYRPTGELTLGLYGNVGLRAGVRVQVPGASFAGKRGASLGAEADIEPWNTQFPLLEKKWTFPRGLGYCLPLCINLTKDGDETDVDCGGSCGQCALGKSCKLNSECAHSVCAGGICSTDHCGDTVHDGDETDVDCGGAKCGKCAEGKGCATGADCASGYCSVWTEDPPICVATHCGNGLKDGDEGGLDCGGPTCDKCAVGAFASSAADCSSGAFNGTICVASTCLDLQLSGDETAVDCGGSCDQHCRLKQACKQAADCAAGLTCHPSQQICLRTVGQACVDGGDCATGVCDNKLCASAGAKCNDGVKDGLETDKDCGGADCRACSVSQRCVVDGDCELGLCSTSANATDPQCVAPAGLLAAWLFEGNGDDASGNGHTATFTTAAFTNQAHSGQQAASFDGASSAAVGAIGLGDAFSITGWVLLPASSLAYGPLISNAPFAYPFSGFTVYANSPETTDLALGFETGDGSTTCTYYTAANALTAGVWQHVALTADRAAGAATLYVGGVAQAASGCVAAGFATNQSLLLGSHDGQFGLSGSLDDLRIYGKVLSAAEIATLATK